MFPNNPEKRVVPPFKIIRPRLTTSCATFSVPPSKRIVASSVNARLFRAQVLPAGETVKSTAEAAAPIVAEAFVTPVAKVIVLAPGTVNKTAESAPGTVAGFQLAAS